MKNKNERNYFMDKVKKYIGPVLIAVYLLYILTTTEYEKTDISLSYLWRSIAPMPENMKKGLIIMGVLIFISVALYVYFMKAGDSNEK